jgi:hypothetical protein
LNVFPNRFDLVELLALTGIVILISAVSSGFLERRGISLVLLFLAIGLAVGPHGLGLANFQLTAPSLQLVATISLTMVLFADAVSVKPPEMRSHARLAALILGPGTLRQRRTPDFETELRNRTAPRNGVNGAHLTSKRNCEAGLRHGTASTGATVLDANGSVLRGT